MADQENNISLIFGRKHCGKSTLAKTLVKDARRLIVLDIQGEYKIGKVVNSMQDFTRFIREHQTARDLRITYCPEYNLSLKTIFKAVCKIVLALRDVTFLVEEVGCFASNATSFPEIFGILVQKARHRQINLVAITQRATKIPRDIRSQADVIYTFQQVEPGDIKYISQFMKLKDVERIEKLSDHKFIEWLPDGKTEIKKITFR